MVIEGWNYTPKTFATPSGHKMSYLDEGSGEAVVMVHGNPTWGYYYRSLVEVLKKKYRIIVPDHIGMGLSDKPKDFSYTLADHIKNLQGLLHSLGVESYNLIVHDWGGAIGLGSAIERPASLKKVVLLNTAAFTDVHIPKRIALCKVPVLGELIVRGANGFAWPATWMAVQKPLNKGIREAYLAPYGSWGARRAIARFVQDIPMSSDHPTWKTLKNIETKLNDIACPKLVIWGGKDFCFNRHFFERWSEIWPDAKTHYLEEAGHYVLEDAQDLCAKEIEAFLE